MAAHTQRPIILPMSNPTPLAEATPADLMRWTGGRALVATGSPFPRVTLDGATYVIPQANNALVFPGLGLGVVVSRAKRITDRMFFAAAQAVAAMVDPAQPGAPLLPQVTNLRTVSAAVATSPPDSRPTCGRRCGSRGTAPCAPCEHGASATS
jgi:malate dehydrogenase (oxaloacetate-decarboxylating)